MSAHDRLSCEELVRRLDAYLDRELTTEEVRLVREHLEGCAKCAAEYAFETRLLGELRTKLQRLRAPGDLLVKVMTSIREAEGGGGS